MRRGLVSGLASFVRYLVFTHQLYLPIVVLEVVDRRLCILEDAAFRFQVLNTVVLPKLLLRFHLFRIVLPSSKSAWIYFGQIQSLSVLPVCLTRVKMSSFKTGPV